MYSLNRYVDFKIDEVIHIAATVVEDAYLDVRDTMILPSLRSGSSSILLMLLILWLKMST